VGMLSRMNNFKRVIIMFYVPDDDCLPSSKRSSLRIIHKFSELYAKINP